MPRRRTDAPLYRRADSPYFWTYTYADGRRRRVSTQCTDREAALSAAAKLQRQAADPRLVHADETVADALVAYSELPLARAEGTVVAIEQRAVALARVLGTVKLRDLNRGHAEIYVRQRAKSYRTLKLELDLLRAAVRLARLRGRQVVEAEQLAVPIPGVVVQKTRWLRQDEVDDLCDALRPHRADWVRVAVWTGCRKAEVNALRWGDVDRERGCCASAGRRGCVATAKRGTSVIAWCRCAEGCATGST